MNCAMAEDMLSRIIRAEREIEERIDSERSRAEEWLALRRAEADLQRAGDEERLQRECAAEVDEAMARAEQQAAAIVREAAEQAGRLTALDDETLRRIIRETIWPFIRPGAA